jgi:hypothetical protein
MTADVHEYDVAPACVDQGLSSQRLRIAADHNAMPVTHFRKRFASGFRLVMIRA